MCSPLRRSRNGRQVPTFSIMVLLHSLICEWFHKGSRRGVVLELAHDEPHSFLTRSSCTQLSPCCGLRSC